MGNIVETSAASPFWQHFLFMKLISRIHVPRLSIDSFPVRVEVGPGSVLRAQLPLLTSVDVLLVTWKGWVSTASKSVQCSNTLNKPVDRHVIVKLQFSFHVYFVDLF